MIIACMTCPKANYKQKSSEWAHSARNGTGAGGKRCADSFKYLDIVNFAAGVERGLEPADAVRRQQSGDGGGHAECGELSAGHGCSVLRV